MYTDMVVVDLLHYHWDNFDDSSNKFPGEF